MTRKLRECISVCVLLLSVSATTSHAEHDVSFRWWHASRQLGIYDGYGSAAFYGLQYTYFIENTPWSVFAIGNWGEWEWEPDDGTTYQRTDVQLAMMQDFGGGFAVGAGGHLFTEDSDAIDWSESLVNFGPELLLRFTPPLPGMGGLGVSLSGAAMPIFWTSKWESLDESDNPDDGVTLGYTVDGALTYTHAGTGSHFRAGYRLMHKDSCQSTKDVTFKGSSFEGPYVMGGIMW